MIHGKLILLLMITAVTAAMQLPVAIAQTSCGVVNLRFHRPDTAHAGEMIKTVSIVTANCFFYSTVILDLVDSRSNMILSRVYWPFDPLSHQVSPPLDNYAIAPNQVGYWALSILVHFAGSTTGIQFTILVD